MVATCSRDDFRAARADWIANQQLMAIGKWPVPSAQAASAAH